MEGAQVRGCAGVGRRCGWGWCEAVAGGGCSGCGSGWGVGGGVGVGAVVVGLPGVALLIPQGSAGLLVRGSASSPGL